MNVAWRNLTRDRARVVVSAGGVGFAVLLILLLRGLFEGVMGASTAYMRGVDRHADTTVIWVAQEGTPGDFFHSVTLMPEETGEGIEAVPGVINAVPLLGRPVSFTDGGSDVSFFMLGVDSDDPVAAPAAVAQGERVPGEGEIVLNRLLADEVGIGIGDTLDVVGTPLQVTGLTSEGGGFLNQFAWVHYDDAARLMQIDGIVNFYLVLAGNGDAEAVADRIEADVPGTLAMTTEEFARENARDLQQGVLPIVWVLMFIGLAIGTMIIGLTIYTATMERRQEYGVLKAIGFTNRRLVAIVWQQAMAAGAIGLAVGIGATFGLAALLERVEPLFVTSYRPVDVVFVSAAALVMSLLASLLPVRPVLRLDPAEVFRG